MINKVIQRNIKISHRKAQLVCDLIRNKPISQAIVILKNTNKKIAPIILKLLNSAIANATNNHAMNDEKLYIYSIVANQGPTLKRTMPRARGSADMIKKRSTHIEIQLSDNPNERKLALEKMKAKKSASKSSQKSKEVKTLNKEDKTETKVTKKVSSTTKAAAPKKEVKAKIDENQKHTVVKVDSFVNEYNYDERRESWHKLAGHNQKQLVCDFCKDDDNWETILLDDGRHVCYYCWIKKPETLKKMNIEDPTKSKNVTAKGKK